LGYISLSGGAQKMILKNYYKEAAPVGVYSLNNFGGLAILDIIGDETAVCAWHYGDGYESIRRHQIFYTYTGRAYIRKAGRRFYFDQILRTNRGN
jgi:hypothetical protein